MFELRLKSVNNDYQVFLDGKELDITYKYNSAIYICNDMTDGKHNIKIKKNCYNLKSTEILIFWLSALLTASDALHISVLRSPYDIEHEYCVEVCGDFKFIFDAFKNQVKFSSGMCNTIKSNCMIDKSIKRKVDILVKLPFFILTCITLMPIWILSIITLLKTFSLFSIALFLLSSLLVLLWIIVLVRVKKYKW